MNNQAIIDRVVEEPNSAKILGISKPSSLLLDDSTTPSYCSRSEKLKSLILPRSAAELETLLIEGETDRVITDEYNIKGKLLGAGSFAQVFQGYWLQNQEKVAIKQF